jgi:tetratricopeptide (TPR) repeat protein
MGQYKDIALVDKSRGPLRECDWLDFNKMRVHTANFDVDDNVPICNLKGTEVSFPAIPHGFDLKDFMNDKSVPIHLDVLNERLEFITHENGVDKYYDKETGQYTYAGRPFGEVDKLLISNDLMKKGIELVTPYLILIQSNPTPEDPNTEQGQKDMKTGIGYLKQAVQLHPHNPVARWYLGKSFHTIDNCELAYKHFKEAYNLAPEDEDYSISLMELCWRMSKFDEALSIARSNLKASPKNQERISDYGCALLYDGKQSRAVRVLKKALEINPDDEITHNRLQYAYNMIEESRESL